MLHVANWFDKAVSLRAATLTAIILTCSSLSTSAADPEVVSIRIKSGVFVLDPANKEIKEGQSIKWVPVVLPNVTHHLVADDPKGAFETEDFNGMNPPTLSFSKPGTIQYHCTKHENSMKGVITVKPASQ